MNLKLFTISASLAGLVASATPQFATAAPFTDTFDSIDPSWVTDREEPSQFASVPFLGDNRLKISIDADDAYLPAQGFYNTQGRKRAANIATPWTISGDLYVDSSFASTTGDLRRTDIWGRDSDVNEASAHYPIFGITNASPTDGYNPAAGDRTTRLRAWDSASGWINIDLPGGFTFDAWHNFEIKATGTAFEYRIDGTLVYTDSTVSSAGNEALKDVYVQAFNFGDSDYDVYWDNVTAVPEPTTLALLSLGGLGLLRRRRA